VTVVVVMGVSGAGKTTVGRALAARLGAPFLDADDFHPEANVRKMASGVPLDDDDRRPWLERLRVEIEPRLESGDDAVLACSALKRSYRAILRRAGERVVFVHLRVGAPQLRSRLERRAEGGSHFMPPGLLESQLEALEPPGADERAIEIDADANIGAVVALIASHLADWEPGPPAA